MGRVAKVPTTSSTIANPSSTAHNSISPPIPQAVPGKPPSLTGKTAAHNRYRDQVHTFEKGWEGGNQPTRKVIEEYIKSRQAAESQRAKVEAIDHTLAQNTFDDKMKESFRKERLGFHREKDLHRELANVTKKELKKRL